MTTRDGHRTTTLTTTRRLALAVIAATLVVGGGVAFGASFTLTPQGCIADVGDAAGCGAVEQGISDSEGVAVSPDGKSVYVAGNGDDAIARFDRDASGALTPQGCVADAGDAAGCGVSQEGLDRPRDVAVSADGKSVYAVSGGDGAIVRFDRDPASGALTPKGCVVDISAGPICGAFLVQEGLDGAHGVAVSPDGKSVYVVSEDDDAIVTFVRNTTSGALSTPSCIADVGDSAGCGATAQGLERAANVAVAPDGKSVYVASSSDDAIVRFDRDTATGALTPQGCVSDVGDTAGCGVTAQGLDQALGVAVSADGTSVYAAGRLDSAVVTFARSASGVLAPQGCVADDAATGCGATAPSLLTADSVAVAPDGNSVYAAATKDHALVSFDRDTANGALTHRGCVGSLENPAGCEITANGMRAAIDVAVSADGHSVYVTGAGDNALVRFDRTEPGSTPPPSDPTDPSNEFSVGKLKGKKLELTVPGAGKVEVDDANAAKRKLLLKHSSADASAPGKVTVTLKLTKTAKRALKAKHKVKVKAAITFTPTGGKANTQTAKLKVKKGGR